MHQETLNIYFAGAIRGGREDAGLYAELIRHLAGLGRVLTEHVGDTALLRQEQSMSEREIFARDMRWLQTADLVVAEVTTPSLGVGYEIARAQVMGKKILCLFRPESTRNLSAMIAGDPDLHVASYRTSAEAKELINRFVASSTEKLL